MLAGDRYDPAVQVVFVATSPRVDRSPTRLLGTQPAGGRSIDCRVTPANRQTDNGHRDRRLPSVCAWAGGRPFRPPTLARSKRSHPPLCLWPMAMGPDSRPHAGWQIAGAGPREHVTVLKATVPVFATAALASAGMGANLPRGLAVATPPLDLARIQLGRLAWRYRSRAERTFGTGTVSPIILSVAARAPGVCDAAAAGPRP